MDFLFRAWKQNIRKPMKSLMIFLVMFVISNLIVTGIFILKGTENATNATLSQIDPVIYYTQDYDRYWRAEELGFVNWETDPMPNISLETAIQIGESDEVKAFDLSTQNSILIRGIKSYKDPNQDTSTMMQSWTTDEEGNTVPYEEPDYFDAIGSSSTEFKIASGTIELLEGRGITPEDAEQSNYVVVIEENLAKTNNLSIGDTLNLDFHMVWDAEAAKLPSDTEHPFEIVGIYRNLSATNGNDAWYTEQAARQMYVPYTIAYELGFEATKASIEESVAEGYWTQEEADEYLESMSTPTVNTVGYLLKNPLKVRDFINDNERLLPSEYHTLKVGNSTFDSIAKSIDSMTQTSNLIIYIVFGAGILILSLITSLTLKSREYEIGVLLSLGESKIKVIGQLMSELLIIALVAFSLSIVSGNFIAKYYGESMLKTQMESTMSQSTSYYVYAPESMYGNDTSTLQYSDFVSSFNIQLDPMVYLELMAYGILVVAISTFIPIIFIMRYNPKTILTIR